MWFTASPRDMFHDPSIYPISQRSQALRVITRRRRVDHRPIWHVASAV